MVTCGSRRATTFGIDGGRAASTARRRASRAGTPGQSTSHVSPASSAKYRALTEAELDARFDRWAALTRCTGARWTIRRPSGARCRGDRLGRAVGTSARRLARAVLPMVRGRAPEHVPQRARPPRRERSGGSARTDLRLPGDRYTGNVHLPRASRCGRTRCGALVAEGVGRGDRVIVYMPMVPEAGFQCSRARESARCTRSSSAGSPRTSSRAESRREAR